MLRERGVECVRARCGDAWRGALVDVDRHTARSQIKALMQKTGVHKQTELLRLIDLCLDLP
jgi:DNA-binding CsgD family transcriptional regulator